MFISEKLQELSEVLHNISNFTLNISLEDNNANSNSAVSYQEANPVSSLGSDLAQRYVLVLKSDFDDLQTAIQRLYSYNQLLLRRHDWTMSFLKDHKMFDEYQLQKRESNETLAQDDISTISKPEIQQPTEGLVTEKQKEELETEVNNLKQHCVQLMTKLDQQRQTVEQVSNSYKRDLSIMVGDAISKLESIRRTAMIPDIRSDRSSRTLFSEQHLESVVEDIFSASNSARSMNNYVDEQKAVDVKMKILQLSNNLSMDDKEKLMSIFKEIQNRSLIVQLQRDNAESALEKMKSIYHEETKRLNLECHTLRESLIDLWESKRR